MGHPCLTALPDTGHSLRGVPLAASAPACALLVYCSGFDQGIQEQTLMCPRTLKVSPGPCPAQHSLLQPLRARPGCCLPGFCSVSSQQVQIPWRGAQVVGCPPPRMGGSQGLKRGPNPTTLGEVLREALSQGNIHSPTPRMFWRAY